MPDKLLEQSYTGWWEIRQTEKATGEKIGKEKTPGEFLPCHLD